MNDDFRTRIRESGLRVTRGRLLLLEYMQRAKRPLGLDDLASLENVDLGDRATVYRNLVALSDAGLIRYVQSVSKKRLYEIQDDLLHAHITCVECGLTENISAPPELPEVVKVKKWRQVQSSVAYWGTCDSCD